MVPIVERGCVNLGNLSQESVLTEVTGGESAAKHERMLMLHRNITTDDILELSRKIFSTSPELANALLEMVQEPVGEMQSASHWGMVVESDV